MNNQTISPQLLSPFNMRDLLLKNRVVVAPVTRSTVEAKRLSFMATYYAKRASAGLIITEAAVISHQALGWLHSPGIYTEEHAEDWKQVVNAAHSNNTPIFLQLWHCGRASHPSLQPDGKLPVAPSAIKLTGDYIHTPIGKQPYPTPKALETEEIFAIIQDFSRAAQLAKIAGFDGVEIHAANGFLIDQFLQTKTNHRTDKYGGSLENRYRFLGEIITAMSKVLSPNHIGVRLSPNGNHSDMGSPDFRETYLYVAQQLNQYGLAYLHVMDGLSFGFHEFGNPMTLAEFREVFTGPIMGNCGYTQKTAEAAIEKGDADLISFGRLFISNPDLVERFANGWPLNPLVDRKRWYCLGKKGCTDFPAYASS